MLCALEFILCCSKLKLFGEKINSTVNCLRLCRRGLLWKLAISLKSTLARKLTECDPFWRGAWTVLLDFVRFSLNLERFIFNFLFKIKFKKLYLFVLYLLVLYLFSYQYTNTHTHTNVQMSTYKPKHTNTTKHLCKLVF